MRRNRPWDRCSHEPGGWWVDGRDAVDFVDGTNAHRSSDRSRIRVVDDSAHGRVLARALAESTKNARGISGGDRKHPGDLPIRCGDADCRALKRNSGRARAPFFSNKLLHTSSPGAARADRGRPRVERMQGQQLAGKGGREVGSLAQSTPALVRRVLGWSSGTCSPSNE